MTTPTFDDEIAEAVELLKKARECLGVAEALATDAKETGARRRVPAWLTEVFVRLGPFLDSRRATRRCF